MSATTMSIMYGLITEVPPSFSITVRYCIGMEALEAERGRPRSAATREAILAAAFVVLEERSYAVEPVAERAGAGGTTIYRW